MVVVLHKARELYIIKKTGTREVVGLFRVVVEAHGTTRQTFAKHVTACGLALGLRMTGTAAALIRHNLSRISDITKQRELNRFFFKIASLAGVKSLVTGRYALVTKRRRSRVSVDFCYSPCLCVREVRRISEYSKVSTNVILPSKFCDLEERTSAYLDVPASNRV
jgi:hypothetical protein